MLNKKSLFEKLELAIFVILVLWIVFIGYQLFAITHKTGIPEISRTTTFDKTGESR